MSAKKAPSQHELPFVIAIVGPTASGKSGLAIELARAIGGEIVSADSRQVYTGLDIGTGKVTRKEMRGVPHHLLDIASPKRQISVETWRTKAEGSIKKILRNGKTPIICGGTGLYLDALLRGMSFPEVPPDLKLRKRLETRSTSDLFQELTKIDPRRASEIDRHNPRRLIRAIEIARAIGKVPKRAEAPLKYRALWIGIDPSDRVLKKRIHDRLYARMKSGMLREAHGLHTTGISYRRMRELGLEYRSLADLIEGKASKEEILDSLEQAIWQYAKRQRTWWKRYDDIHWISGPSLAKVKSYIKKRAV
jgi:tRNA dimethylallyltransferase